MDISPKYSIILPAYNEAANIAPMMERLLAAGEKLDGPFEIVWVNDGSTDDTAAILDETAAEYPCVRTLHFSRNFGHMAALCAGLEAAHATHAVITLDADGQHPPELISEMVSLWQEGGDIVQSIRRDSGELGIGKRLSSRWFYTVFRVLANTNIPEGAADFRLLDREVVDALNNLPERVRFVRGLVHWVGFNRVTLPYTPEARISGETKYSMLQMMSFALNGITSFSVRPLRLAFVLTLLVLGLVAIYSVYVLLAMFTGKDLTPGWTSTMFIILFLGSAQLLVIGIASEYLARMYVEQKQRPVYIVRREKT
ncbi:MAG: glycosyltransferase family 2 protein, partial [Candidatus Hydrogenedentes bacterium]|nr:glycosyltransferase family 2 protein [Candidatus Hydrogenedentota bacterium]